MDFYVLKKEEYKIAKRGNAYYFIMGKGLTGNTIRESLKTDDLKVAEEKAKQRYNEYYEEYSTELFNSNDKSFQSLAEQFLKENTYNKHKEYMKRLYLPYFTKEIGTAYKIKDVSKITTKDIQNYLKYRRGLKTKAGTFVRNTTIQREWHTLVQFFTWCYQNNFIKKPLVMPKIKEKDIVRDENGEDAFDCYDNCRDTFTDAEIKTIFNEYETEIANEVNAHTKRRLVLAYRYSKILHLSGFRTCDLRRVVWSSFEVLPDGKGMFHNFYAKKKKDRRDVYLCPNTTKILQEMKQEIENFCEIHNIVFDKTNTPLFCLCNKVKNKEEYNLKPVKEFDGGFRKLLQRCGIDGKGKKCLYSWRHTFITKKCLAGVEPIKIAAHCGTSIAMIEKYYMKVNNLINPEELFLEPIAA